MENIIELNQVREHRKQYVAEQVLARMTKALLNAYQTRLATPANNLSDYEAISKFIHDELRYPDETMAEVIFPIICDRLEQRLRHSAKTNQGELS